MSNFLSSRKIRTTLWILGGLILLFVAFGLGVALGYRRAGFAAGFDADYYRNFIGAGATSVAPAGFMMPPPPTVTHGVVGTVIDLGTSTVSVENGEGNERSVEVPSGTVIREGDQTIVIGNMAVGDQITVIGEPNDQGQIVARFIRIFSASSTPNQQ